MKTKIAGTKEFAQRTLDNEDRAAGAFIDYAMKTAGLTNEEARRALAKMLKAKVLKLDAMDGAFKVQHGSWLDAGVLQYIARA